MARPTDIQADLRAAFQQAWDQQATASDVEPNLSLIAAYIDGRLNEREEHELARRLIDCPAAWEIMEHALPAGEAFPRLPEADGGNAPGAVAARAEVSLPPPAASSSPRGGRGIVWTVAVAASWLAAVACGGALWRLQSEARGIRDQLALAREFQAGVELAELAERVSAYRTVYLVGEAELGLVRAALRNSGTRGSSEPSQAELAGIENSLSEVKGALQDVESLSASRAELPRRLAEVSSLILAGKLPEADRVLSGLEADPGADAAAIRNARAAWQMTLASDPATQADEAQRLVAAAEATFRDVAQQGQPLAWLNLALRYLDEGRATEAVVAAMEYLKTNPDPAIANLVRETFGL